MAIIAALLMRLSSGFELARGGIETAERTEGTEFTTKKRS